MSKSDDKAMSDSSMGNSTEEISSKGNPNENHVASMAPLYQTSVIGRNIGVSIVNLTKNSRKAIAFSCCHSVVILNYESQEPMFLQGHKNLITSLSCDMDRSWLVSSDTGAGNSIIVWSMESFCTVCTFQPSSETYMTKISSCGGYIVSVSSEDEYIVCSVWILENERKDPDGSYKFGMNLGTVNNIAFDLNSSAEFMLTTSRTVLFFNWKFNSPNPMDPEVCVPSPIPKKYDGQLTESFYLNGHTQCITSTTDGSILVWNDSMNASWEEDNVRFDRKKSLEKWYHLQKGGITCLCQLNKFVVTGDSLGTIRFYDHLLCLIYWIQNAGMPENLIQIEFHLQSRISIDNVEFEDSSGGKLDTISQMADSEIGGFPKIKDFIVVDNHGCVYLIDFLKNKSYILYETHKEVITYMDVHPESDMITFGDEKGQLRMVTGNNCWYNYIKSISDFVDAEDNTITCVKYTSIGNHLAVGMKSGELFFVDSCLYQPKQEKPFHLSSTSISKICFSPDDSFMAHTDEVNTVTLYGSRMEFNPDSHCPEWIFCGRVCPHYDTINCLTFDPYPAKTNRLLSVANDYSLVEYSLKIRESEGLGILTRNRIEQTAYPLHICWSTDSLHKRCLVITNSEYKYKLYNIETKEYRQTFQGPVYDGPISFCQMLKQSNGEEVMLYATNTQIGLQMLPLDGNPYKAAGVVAHPVKLVAVAVSSDNKTVFTLGEKDTCIAKWFTNISALEALHSEGGTGLEPYYCMMEGGHSGWLFQQAIDYFYLAQLLHEGHLWQSEHIITCAIKTCELAHVMRSLGYFAADHEIESMLHEIFSEISPSLKRDVNDVEFEDFIRLFLNHKPAKGITSEELATNFKILSRGRHYITKQSLISTLKQKGETMADDELSMCLNILLHETVLNKNSSSANSYKELPEELTQNIIEDALLGIKNIEKEDEK